MATSFPGSKGDTEIFSRPLSRVLLQEIPTGRYFQTSGFWTWEVGKATDFQTGSAALECAMKLRLPNVQVVFMQEIKSCRIHPVKSSMRSV